MKMFKINKAVSFTIKQEVLDSINHYAKKLELYDDRFDLEAQCGGYHAFKALCLMKEDLGEIPFDARNILGIGGNPRPGLYLIMKIHPNLRDQAWAAAKVVRKRHNLF